MLIRRQAYRVLGFGLLGGSGGLSKWVNNGDTIWFIGVINHSLSPPDPPSKVWLRHAI